MAAQEGMRRSRSRIAIRSEMARLPLRGSCKTLAGVWCHAEYGLLLFFDANGTKGWLLAITTCYYGHYGLAIVDSWVLA